MVRRRFCQMWDRDVVSSLSDLGPSSRLRPKWAYLIGYFAQKTCRNNDIYNSATSLLSNVRPRRSVVVIEFGPFVTIEAQTGLPDWLFRTKDMSE